MDAETFTNMIQPVGLRLAIAAPNGWMTHV